MVDLVRRRPSCAARAGSSRGLCPFHDERTPSFSVNAADKVFHCFGCGEGGDLFKFVQLTEGVTSARRWSCWPIATASSSS